MSDILLHNAISKGTVDMRQQLLGEPSDINAILSKSDCYLLWASVMPKIPSPAGTLCVYDSGVYFRGGNTCTWTVPAGITKARFELWGAGAGSQSSICCGHAPTGNSGAYASVCMTVTPGQQYVLCAGAASSVQTYCGGTTDVSGCPSYVTGAGLTNFCAMGGCSNLLYTMCQIGNTQAVFCCKWAGQGYGGSQSGGGICGSGFGGVCSTTYPMGTLYKTFVPGTSYYGTATGSTVYGIKGQIAAEQWDGNTYGCHCSYSLPLPNGTMSPLVCDGWTSGSCCGSRGVQACSGCHLVPGFGGFWTHVMGGSTGIYGDWGRTGMVKVSWA